MLINKNFFLISLVIISMLSISQFFGTAKVSKEIQYMSRQINLSGNIVKFSMPENFSPDFPANDLVKSLDITNSDNFKKSNSVELLRRWWDFKDDSFFAKEMGTMMMTIHVYHKNDSTEELSHPVGFVKTLLSEMEKRSKEENLGRSGDDIIFFPEHYQSFIQLKYNNQSWFSSGSGTMSENDKVFYYWVPVTENHFLAVEFHFAPSTNTSFRPFIDQYCRDVFEKIMSSFDILYSSENSIKAKLKDNSHLNLE